MKYLLAFLLTFGLGKVAAQFTPVAGQNTTVTINGDTYKIFVPADYFTSPASTRYYFHVAWSGVGETNGPATENQVTGKWLQDAGVNWNGEVVRNDGSIAKFVIFSIPYYGSSGQTIRYANAIDSVFKAITKIDTLDKTKLSMSGLSIGGGLQWLYLTGQEGITTPYRHVFLNTISMSPVSPGLDITSRTTSGYHHIWYSSLDPNGGTPPSAAINLYNDVGSSDKVLTDQPVACHCATIWDEAMSITGLNIANGGTAATNRWRRLANDGAGPPPPPGNYKISATNGDWSNTSTWVGNVLPISTDSVVIAHTVTYNLSSATFAGIYIRPGATLQLNSGQTVTLQSTKNIQVQGILRSRPSSNSIIHTIRFTGVNESAFIGGGMDVLVPDVGLWVMGAGQLDIEGTQKTAWTRLAGAGVAGTSSILLATTPVNWVAGDEIVIAPTLATHLPSNVSSDTTLFDRRLVTSTSGATINLNGTLTYNHPTVFNNRWKAEVMNLTRNVRIEGTASGRAHIFVRSTSPQTLKYAHVRYMGPRKDIDGNGVPEKVGGRYGIHFHHSFDGSRGSVIEGVVMRDNGSHSYVPHLSHGLIFRDDIAYNVTETAFWWDGAQASHDIIFDRDVVAIAKFVPGSLDVTSDNDDGVPAVLSAGGFLLGFGDNNEVTNCVTMFTNGDPEDGGGYDWDANNDGVWFFNNNLAHNANCGIVVWQVTSLPHVVTNFDAYYCTDAIFHGAYGNVYKYNHGVIYASPVILKANSINSARVRLENYLIDGANMIPNGILLEGAQVSANIPTLIRNTIVQNTTSTAILLNSGFGEDNGDGTIDTLLKFVDVIQSTFVGTPSMTVDTWNAEIIRVQPTSGQSYRVIKSTGTPTIQNIANFAPSNWADGDGLMGYYYNEPNFTSLALTRLDQNYIYFDDWMVRVHYSIVQDNSWSVRWLGRVTPYATEAYTFTAGGVGTYRVYLNNNLIINAVNGATASAPQNLISGQFYDLRLEYIADPDNANAFSAVAFGLLWSSPSINTFTPGGEFVPQSQLSSIPLPPTWNYFPGQQRKYDIAGNDVLISMPSDTTKPKSEYYLIFNTIDSTGKDSTYAVSKGLAKKIKNGWNSLQTHATGTARFIVVTHIENPHSSSEFNKIVDTIFKHYNRWIDTTNTTAARLRRIRTGIGQGAQYIAAYHLNNSFYAPTTKSGKFGQIIPVDLADFPMASNQWPINQPLRTWAFVGTSNTYPFSINYTRQWIDSANNYLVSPYVKSTEVGGQNYSVITQDSAYSSVGIDAETNLFRWLVDPYEGEDTTLQKIAIHKWWPMDFSGTDQQGSRDSYFMFDSPSDPKRGILPPSDNTSGEVATTRDIFYRRHNQRHVWLNFQKPMVIREIWVYDGKGAQRPDTVSIYTKGSRINQPSFISADLRTRNDYLVRPIAAGNAPGWRRVWKGTDTTQYVYVMSRYNKYTSPTEEVFDPFREYVFYGYELPGGVPETIYNLASEANLSSWSQQRVSVGTLTGSNFPNNFDHAIFPDYENLRKYGQYEWYTEGGRYPYNKLVLQANGDGGSISWHDSVSVARYLAKYGKVPNIWYAMQNTNRYIVDTTFAVPRNYDSLAGPFTWMRSGDPSKMVTGSGHRAINTIGDDPGNPFSYTTAANTMYMWVAYYGGNPSAPVDTSKVKVNMPGNEHLKMRRGMGINQSVEFGNEENNKFEAKYLTPVEAAAKQVALYDGWSNQLGSQMGVKNADPNINVKLPATSGGFYRYQMATIIASKIFYGQNKLPFDDVEMHIYHVKKRYNPAGDSTLHLFGHSVHPESNGYSEDIDTAAKAFRAAANANIKVGIGEYGFDKTYIWPECVNGCANNIFAQTLYGLPLNDIGLDSARWQAVLLVRTLSDLLTKPVNSAAQFMLVDEAAPTDVATVPYSRSGQVKIGPDNYSATGGTTYASQHYFHRDFGGRWHKWIIDSVVDKTLNGRYVLRFRHTTSPDSVMHMIYKSDTFQVTGMVNYTVVATSAVGQVVEFVPSFTATAGVTNTLSPIPGSVNITAGIVPRFILYKKVGIIPPQNIIIDSRHGAVIKILRL